MHDLAPGWNEKIIIFIATGFGLGQIPVAPGTFGTLAALPLIWALGAAGPVASSFLLVAFILAAIHVADRAATFMGRKDPGSVVIDEMVGYCVALSLVPVGVATLIAGFLAFRVFDIAKPGPVRYFEKNYSGGAGIVLDDVMAGLMAAVVVKCLYLWGLL